MRVEEDMIHGGRSQSPLGSRNNAREFAATQAAIKPRIKNVHVRFKFFASPKRGETNFSFSIDPHW